MDTKMDKMVVFRLCLLREKRGKYLGRVIIKTKYDKKYREIYYVY